MTTGGSSNFTSYKTGVVRRDSKAADMDTLLELGKEAGLEGKDLLQFVVEQQNIQREIRAAEREVEKLKAEATKIESEAQLQLHKEKARSGIAKRET